MSLYSESLSNLTSLGRTLGLMSTPVSQKIDKQKMSRLKTHNNGTYQQLMASSTLATPLPLVVGQDHFYLAKTHQSTSRNQVKRRLNLELPVPDSSDGFKTPKAKRIRTTSAVTPTSITSSPKTSLSSPLNRFDTSLGILTKKFVGILTSAPNGVVDLNEASLQLSVQKRRIYDITNVLEGIGLIEKKSKNNIQWRGASGTVSKTMDNYELAQRDLDILEAKENYLDELINSASLQLKMLTENNCKTAYVTYRDLRSIRSFYEQTIIAVKAPPETKLEVPDPRESLQIWLKSERGEIEVLLCPEDYDTSLDDDDKKDKTPHSIEEESELGEGSSENPPLRYALISEEDDLAPMGKHFLLQTEDQNSETTPFLPLEPPLSDSDYTFTLSEGEGISDLFDAYDFKV